MPQNSWISGIATNCVMAGVNCSYRLAPNIYLDFGGVKRRFTADNLRTTLITSTGTTMGNNSETWVYFGIRINAPRRAYDVYY
jgi:hypothetical protein